MNKIFKNSRTSIERAGLVSEVQGVFATNNNNHNKNQNQKGYIIRKTKVVKSLEYLKSKDKSRNLTISITIKCFILV